MSVELVLERVAHGGYVVARHDGKVVFVTGGLPGERVRAEITQTGRRFDRARVVEVIDAAPGRVRPPCPIADECGGCDWQHADHATQIDLKTAVVSEVLARLGGFDWAGRVQPVEPFVGWRTRMRYAVTDDGEPGMRARRSHDVVALPDQGCLIAAAGPTRDELRRASRSAEEVRTVVSGTEVTMVAGQERISGPAVVHEVVGERTYEVDATGFWQVHPRAATLLVTKVLDGLRVEPGERALDLYCGVGLFAGALADAGCRVVGVELSKRAVAQARRNVGEAEFLAGPLEKLLKRLPQRSDVVVLDPPRKGAGADVVDHIVGMRPRAVAYVACDPAALARDIALFRGHGWEVTGLEAFDLFPMTHHVECVAILHPGPGAEDGALD